MSSFCEFRAEGNLCVFWHSTGAGNVKRIRRIFIEANVSKNNGETDAAAFVGKLWTNRKLRGRRLYE